jgi:acyl-CoA oxidase
MESTDESFIPLNQQIIDLIQNNNLFKKNYGLDFNVKIYREITFQRLKEIIKLQVIDVFSIITRPDVFFSVINTLHLYDLSLAIKTGVNFGLFGGALLRYGESNQIDRYLQQLNRGEIFGCLAITEDGHGSNLKDLETTATYNHNIDRFIINSPSSTSSKTWIGNTACHGTHAVVFAQLIYFNKNMGLHPFLVKIRYRRTGQVVGGITITDNGLKKGLNGVDNGKIHFNQVSIKRNKLLRNFGFVDEYGKYHFQSEEHRNSGKRFGELLATLSGGRGVLGYGSNVVSLKSLYIALLYAQKRRQFNLDGGPERPIIEYTTHQTKLIPLFAKSIVLQNGLNQIKKLAVQDFNMTNGKVTKRIHTLTSGLKIFCSEHAEESCRITRKLCGANGFSSENEIAQMHDDIDIYQTFEGDNTLLRQEMCKNILASFDTDKLEQLRKRDIINIENKEDLLYLLQYRTLHLTNEIIQKLISYARAGYKNGDTWNFCLPEVMTLADAYMYEKLFEISMTRCDQNFIILFAYQSLFNNADWFIINNLINASTLLNIKDKFNELCRALCQSDTLDKILNNFELLSTFCQVSMLSVKCNL